MQELQYLFALMIGSNRKFVDPSAALDLLKGAFRSPEEQQVQEVLILVNSTVMVLCSNCVICCEHD